MLFKTLHTNSGVTLIEVLIAMLVLTIGILSLYIMQLSAIRGNSRASLLTEASTWNAGQLEQMIGLDYDASVFFDTDSDGTGQDTDHDGIDDDGGNFGLDDMTATTADGSTDVENNKYTIFWNVARDVPMPNMITIRVLVQDNSNILSAPVVFTYIKADII